MLKRGLYRKILFVVIIIAVCCMALLIVLKSASNKMEYNKVKEGDNYLVSINDSNGEMIYEDLYRAEPIISEVGKNTIMVEIGAGNTSNSIFINGKTGKVSDFFPDVVAYNEKLVVYPIFENGELKIIIRDIYDKNNVYEEITDAFSETAVGLYDVKEAKVINDHQVYLNYYIGDDRKEKERLILIK